jgi:hypothetical protein
MSFVSGELRRRDVNRDDDVRVRVAVSRVTDRDLVVGRLGRRRFMYEKRGEQDEGDGEHDDCAMRPSPH